jgi:ABC-type sugar transport system substrate-binding protein
MRIERSRGVLALVAVLLLALFAGACGSDDEDEGGGGNKGTGIRAGKGKRTEEAQAAGRAAAKEEGPKVTLDPKTVGIISILGGIESADRLQATMEQAAKDLGWKSVPCDGQGDPRKMVACGDSLLDRNVDAIVTIAIDTSLIKPVIAKAKKNNVPILQNAGESGDGYDASFYPSEEEKAAVLSDAIVKRMEQVTDKPAELIIQDYPAPWAADRTEVLKDKVSKASDIEIVADTQTDATQLLEYTRKTVSDQLTQHKDVDAFWFAFDATGQAGGPVIAKAYPGKKFPERPLIATFHADLGTQALMRQDQIDIVVDSNYDAAVWMAYDALAQHFARDKPFDLKPQPEYPGVGQLFFNETITKENLPPEGEYVETPVDVPAYFEAKWKAEFGK